MASEDATVTTAPAPYGRSGIVDFAWAFVPFALLITGGQVLSILADSVVHARTQFPIWTSMAYSGVAIALLILQLGGRPSRLWRLVWLFALLSYLVHFAYAYGAMFENDVSAVVAEQGIAVAAFNFGLTALWILDVVVALIVRRPRRLVTLLHLLTAAGVFAGFVVSTVTFARSMELAVAGYVLIAVVAGSLIVRIFQGPSDPIAKTKTVEAAPEPVEEPPAKPTAAEPTPA